MTLTKKRLAPLSSVFFLLFTACSGGYLSVSNNVDVYKSAGFHVSALETAGAAQRSQIVQDLYGKRGDNLNWEEFWAKLRLSSQRESILGDVEGPLLALHERGCTEPGYAEFVRLIAATGRGYAYIIGTSARCDLPLGAELSALVTKGYLRSVEGQDLTDSESQTLLAFLNRQIEATPEGKWREFCQSDFESDVRRLVDSNFAAGRSKETVSWMLAIHRASGKFPLRSYLFERVITSSQLLRGVIEQVGFTGAAILVADLIDSARSRIESGEVQISPSQATALVNELWAEAVAKPNSISQLWPDFSRFKRTLMVVGKAWSLRERLALQNLLLLKIENSVRTTTSQERQIFFDLTFNTHAGSPADLDTLWLMLRTAHDRLESTTDRENARLLVARAYADASGIEERVLARRLSVHLADGGKNRRLATDDFCSELETAGLKTTLVSIAEAKLSLTQGMEAGCYRMPVVADDQLVSITGQAVRMSPDAALRVDTPKMILQVAQAELGILDLSRSQTIPFVLEVMLQKRKPVLPIPLVYEVMTPPAGSPAGKHVFFTHLIFEGTTNVITAPYLSGKTGGILSAQINEAPRAFAFVSEGGRGQIDRRRDYSLFRSEAAQAFTNALTGLGSVHRSSTAETLNLIAGAGTPLSGSAYSDALLKYLEALANNDYLKQKMVGKCNQLRPGLPHGTDTQLLVCVIEQLVPLALTQATATLSTLSSTSDETVKQKLSRRFNSDVAFWSPEAPLTSPDEVEGMRGADGVSQGITGGGL